MFPSAFSCDPTSPYGSTGLKESLFTKFAIAANNRALDAAGRYGDQAKRVADLAVNKYFFGCSSVAAQARALGVSSMGTLGDSHGGMRTISFDPIVPNRASRSYWSDLCGKSFTEQQVTSDLIELQVLADALRVQGGNPNTFISDPKRLFSSFKSQLTAAVDPFRFRLGEFQHGEGTDHRGVYQELVVPVYSTTLGSQELLLGELRKSLLKSFDEFRQHDLASKDSGDVFLKLVRDKPMVMSCAVELRFADKEGREYEHTFGCGSPGSSSYSSKQSRTLAAKSLHDPKPLAYITYRMAKRIPN